MFTVRVHSGCGNWVSFDVPENNGNVRPKSCWNCNEWVKVERHGKTFKGYRQPPYSPWVETQVDVSREETRL